MKSPRLSLLCGRIRFLPHFEGCSASVAVFQNRSVMVSATDNALVAQGRKTATHLIDVQREHC
jgi:hypothetical protein